MENIFWGSTRWRARHGLAKGEQPVDVLPGDSEHSGLKEMSFGSLPQQGACSWPPTGASKARGKTCRFLGWFEYHYNLKIWQINSVTSLDKFFFPLSGRSWGQHQWIQNGDKDLVISREEFCLQINSLNWVKWPLVGASWCCHSDSSAWLWVSITGAELSFPPHSPWGEEECLFYLTWRSSCGSASSLSQSMWRCALGQ